MFFNISTALLLLIGPALLPLHAQSRARTPASVEDPLARDNPKEDPDGLSLDELIQEKAPSSMPTFVSLAPNINDFGRFADGGSDSNWYIGFNNAWIVRLPPIPVGKYRRALIGAKIGRAKTHPRADRPWEHEVNSGKIYMAVSQRPSFTPDQQFYLVETEDIPLESNDKIYLSGAGRSQWFWTEVPLNAVSANRPNYLIIWSPAREFRDAATSPILAALEPGPDEQADEPEAWNNHAIQGVPPRSENGALQVPIKIKPALAIKLVPPAPSRKVKVDNFSIRSSGGNLLTSFSVEGRDIEAAWLESSSDELEWRRVSPLMRQAPYILTLPRSALPARGAYLRAAARDSLSVEGYSKTLLINANANR